MQVEEIKQRAVVAVIRGTTLDTIIPIAEALKAGGVTALEITMETPKALDIIEKLSDELGPEILVGAGTVLDPETARAAILSGARFVFSPTVRKETIEMTKRYGIISVAGALTPTEILTAYEFGADLIKVFPAAAMGAEYFKSISGPLPQIPLMPTGGIDINNTGTFIKAGAAAVGVGSTLVNTKEKLSEGYLLQLTDKAERFIKEVEQARDGKTLAGRL
ncbi:MULTISPECIES: bifunctional 4-hydroxy-2-oxoglutarate aldolase/2-dehydro-3-deoxy-phosphogluconate aldolase [Bacillus]|uniref:2-dehydro-3-deoxyphosphogluconate aldolase n=2 Tax=Bacillus TaxID=1386 RepID=A0A0M4FJ06_9BACI|nr:MULTISPECIES: bifunctional 4-hydroxy-2-oxoglutarate aldolase/2-dehydro-3-deoxy-phosphogluconate aldolase [Bacillus]ALC82987.1 2-dehydro-3-deoxyphosphogluconate aldolase [Bacillus gobiensis]MBP1081999.1 2-dehydro-3-deoxyphosphogluconate aldolase/(4S)-4-hydroxy-2-oxoglutarate aldolase [Bacillus capparidis]MED1096634.1 bifunctional 4-hydroxy-2-oxoglutarate aldolase/2-dehydro-3-deoxy-phosphogluconate aldolase [Bacillus capparidis]